MKKVNSFLLVFILSITSIIGQINLKNGLVACYPFNGKAKDESGNNSNGRIKGARLKTVLFGINTNACHFKL